MTQLIHQLEILDVAEQQSEPPTQGIFVIALTTWQLLYG